MSLFSYIAFPRKVDLSTYESNINALKKYKIGELVWNKNEYRIERGSANDGVRFTDCGSIPWNSHLNGLYIMEDKTLATFKRCFKNKHIYLLEGSLNYNGSRNINDTTGLIASLLEHIIVEIEVCRKQLYELAERNLREGEFIEIYSEHTNHMDFDLGPPSKELIISADEILYSMELDLYDRLRIVINR